MSATLTLPIWAVAAFVVAAAVGVYCAGVAPLWRWFWDRRSERVVERVNPHLQLKLSPFTLTRRRVLADRIANDPAVQQGPQRALFQLQIVL